MPRGADSDSTSTSQCCMLWEACFMQSLISLYSYSLEKSPWSKCWLKTLASWAGKHSKGKETKHWHMFVDNIQAPSFLVLVPLLQACCVFWTWRARTWCSHQTLHHVPGGEDVVTDHRHTETTATSACSTVGSQRWSLRVCSQSSTARIIKLPYTCYYFYHRIIGKGSRAI